MENMYVIIGFAISFLTGLALSFMLRKKLSSPITQEGTVINSIPHLVAVQSVETGLMVFNLKWTDYLGFSPTSDPELWSRIVHSEDWSKIQTLYAEAFENRKPFQAEYRILRTDGNWRWHLIRSEFEKNQAGDFTKCVSTSTDIHAQKLAEAEKENLLLENKSKSNMLSSVIEQMPLGVVVGSADRTIISQNKLFKGYFSLNNVGHKIGRLVGYNLDGTPVGEKQWPLVISLISGKTNDLEFYTLSDAGDKKIYFASASAVLAPSGEIVAGVCVIQDITDKNRQAQERAQAAADHNAAREIRKSQIFLEALVENMPHLIFMKETETFKYIKANRAFLETYDPDGSGMIGKSSFDLFEKEQAQQMLESDQNALLSNGVVELPRHQLTFNGNAVRTYQTKKFVIEGDNGKKVLVGISTDITDAVTAEGKMIQAKDQAELVAKMKSEFLANMSHEIRTPLNGVIGVTELILEGPLEDKQRDYVKLVRDSGEALLSIVNDVLDFSKVESGLIELEKIDFELRTTFSSHLEMLRMRARSKDLSFTYDFDAQLPQFLVGDPNRIAQILNNLIGNAIKFTDSGGKIEVTAQLVHSDNQKSLLRFKISDTGIGLTTEQKAKLFRPFVQADGSMARRYGGTGLGLSICKKLVELMNGEISIESKKDEGSDFIFTIELGNCKPSQKAAVPSAVVDPVKEKRTAFTGKRVLLVEDNEVNRMLAEALLQRFGYQVDLAKNGLEAVDASGKLDYDLILMDCQMPELDGYEATRRIRDSEQQSSKHVPIIALTANAREEDRDRCLSVGMDDFVSKPIKRDVLDSMLKKWIQLSTVTAATTT